MDFSSGRASLAISSLWSKVIGFFGLPAATIWMVMPSSSTINNKRKIRISSEMDVALRYYLLTWSTWFHWSHCFKHCIHCLSLITTHSQMLYKSGCNGGPILFLNVLYTYSFAYLWHILCFHTQWSWATRRWATRWWATKTLGKKTLVKRYIGQKDVGQQDIMHKDVG